MSNPPSGTPTTEKARLFLSYGRADAEELAERLEADLSLLGFDVWRDRRKIRSGKEWDDEIEAGLRTSQLVVAVLTPHAVREESLCRSDSGSTRAKTPKKDMHDSEADLARWQQLAGKLQVCAEVIEPAFRKADGAALRHQSVVSPATDCKASIMNPEEI